MVGLHKIGIKPNHVTIAAIILSALMGYMLHESIHHHIYLLLVPLGYLLRMALNAIDGMMARSYKLSSTTGAILNELGDIVSDVFIFIGFWSFAMVDIHILTIFIVMAVVNETCGILSQALFGERSYNGPMGKSDRALVIGLLCIVLYFLPAVTDFINHIMIVCSILMIISSWARLRVKKA
jgi:CDP-diacylglycerol--glycerol-3-phosphate 3-phosphatidyltransferase